MDSLMTHHGVKYSGKAAADFFFKSNKNITEKQYIHQTKSVKQRKYSSILV